MFQQAGRRDPGMQPNLIHSQSDINAKEKLSTYIYEYLSITGATKTAEAFREEVLANTPSLAALKPPEKGSSFLLDWWTVFWDLYCAAPERRDQGEPTPEARYYHDHFINNVGPCGMNGGPPFGGPAMGMPPDGMMGVHPGGFPGRFPGHARMPAGAMPPAGYGMFPGDPRMARMPPSSMRMAPGGPFPGAQMRPGVPGAPPGGLPPGMRYGGFMESPGQPFPPGAAMMPNGGMPMAMSSPGMPGAPPPDAQAGGPPPFMPMGGMPTSSSAMPFGMSDTSVSMGNGSAPPAPESVQCSGAPGIPTGVAVAMNGDELKQSPASTPRGAGPTGGTPAPGSAQSTQQPVTPIANVGSAGALSDKQQDDSEISKIKEGLLDGFNLKQESGENFFT